MHLHKYTRDITLLQRTVRSFVQRAFGSRRSSTCHVMRGNQLGSARVAVCSRLRRRLSGGAHLASCPHLPPGILACSRALKVVYQDRRVIRQKMTSSNYLTERQPLLERNGASSAAPRRPGPRDISRSHRYGILAGIWAATLLSVGLFLSTLGNT